MGHTKRLPIGEHDFKTLRDNDEYYVDKSMLIDGILGSNSNGAFLFARPGRFGRSLNLSMLDAFFNIEYRGNKWFNDLEISKHHEYDRFKNSFPVIHVDLKSDGGTLDSFYASMVRQYRLLLDRFSYLKESDKVCEYHKRMFEETLSGTVAVNRTRNMLTNFSIMLRAHHGKKAIILIDNYDSTMMELRDHEDAEEARAYVFDMLSSALKGNESLQLGVVMGVLHIVDRSIFSGLNNLMVDDILSDDSGRMFGFTDDDVMGMCSYYGHPEGYRECRLWYGGYRFGDADVFDPSSVLDYVGSGFKARAYRTEGDGLIGDLLGNADDSTMSDVLKLSQGKGIRHCMQTSMTVDDVRDLRSIYSVMAMSGCLKAEDKGGYQILTVPNMEMREVFSSMLFKSLPEGNDSARMFAKSLVQGDVDGITESLYALFGKDGGIRILTDEYAYQAFIAGLSMGLFRSYDMTVDMESGNGCLDVRFIPKMRDLVNVIIVVKEGDGIDAESLAKVTIERIKEKNQASGLKGKTVLYGIALAGEEPSIVSETMDL